MKEIKFRAWDKNAGKLHLVKSINYADDGFAKTISVHLVGGINYGYVHGESCELMQYTGLTDRNGKEIYEGDIIRSVALSNDHHQRGAIVVSPVEYWNGNACLSITHTPIFPFCIDHEIEVIGNIYANPELLEVS